MKRLQLALCCFCIKEISRKELESSASARRKDCNTGIEGNGANKQASFGSPLS
jgi:hypothetical protein